MSSAGPALVVRQYVCFTSLSAPLFADVPLAAGGAPVTAGADEGCGLRVTAVVDGLGVVGPRHAQFCVEEDGTAYVTDLSRSGTFVNGQRLAPGVATRLAPADIVSLAGREYTLRGELNPLMFRVAPAAAPAADADAPAGPPLPPELAQRFIGSFECSICTGTLLNPFSMSCGHTFCGDCLANWYASRKTCPLCRGRLPPFANPFPCRTLDDFLESAVAPELPADERAARRRRMQIWNNRRDLIASKRTRAKRKHVEIEFEFASSDVDEISSEDEEY
jgi:hypothetical protein